ncbi:MAG: hypothetical protein ACE5LC_08900 [Candidatus Aminicenantales bacterium]
MGKTKNWIKKEIEGKRYSLYSLAALFFALIITCSFLQAQEKETASRENFGPKIFIECETCDLEFIQKSIRFANFVQTPREAEVYILITSRKLESGEVEYILTFTGQGKFEGDDDKLTYTAEKPEEIEKTKKELTDILKMGLMRYVGKTPLSNQISIKLMEEVKPTAVVDKWDFWVFSISANTFLNGEKLYKSGMYFASFAANRVTPELKVRLSLGGMLNRSRFTYDDMLIKSSSDSLGLNALIVKSIDEHWSAGAFFSVNYSTYSNIKFSITPAPAIEFNLFPYSQFTRKQLRFLYRLGLTSVSYLEETIYLKTYEVLLGESLSISLDLKQKWGTLSVSLQGSHYFHDLSKNRVQLWGELSLRIIRGLNFNISGSFSRIRDQLSLPRAGASIEEILLRLKELATNYTYRFSIGLSFTFGSIHSKVVNPRFGEGGGGISIRF